MDGISLKKYAKFFTWGWILHSCQISDMIPKFSTSHPWLQQMTSTWWMTIKNRGEGTPAKIYSMKRLCTVPLSYAVGTLVQYDSTRQWVLHGMMAFHWQWMTSSWQVTIRYKMYRIGDTHKLMEKMTLFYRNISGHMVCQHVLYAQDLQFCR